MTSTASASGDGTTVASEAEETLAFQMKAADIPFEREVRFAPPRKWRFDFVVRNTPTFLFAVEVDGGAWSGGHRRGNKADKECEKLNEAALGRWTVLHFTPAMVEDGRALATIEKALGR